MKMKRRMPTIDEFAYEMPIDEGKFKKGYWVILTGKISGELSREFASTKAEIKEAVIKIASNGLEDGDMISISKGETEI